jgi:hypothetical protein
VGGRAAELASEAARAEGASLTHHRPWPAARVIQAAVQQKAVALAQRLAMVLVRPADR